MVAIIGASVKRKRIEKGLSRNDLAYMCFTDKSQIHKLEEGLTENITIHTIYKIAEALEEDIIKLIQ